MKDWSAFWASNQLCLGNKTVASLVGKCFSAKGRVAGSTRFLGRLETSLPMKFMKNLSISSSL